MNRFADIKNIGEGDRAAFDIKTGGIKAYWQAKDATTARSYVTGRRVHIDTEDTVYRLANPIYASILQQYQKGFTAKGGVDFHPNEIRLRRLKIDDSFYPSDIVETWLGWLAGDSSRNQEEWPLVRWLFEEYYANQIAEDKEMLAVYKGVYEAPTTGTAGSGDKVFDGLRKQLQTGAADTDYPINVVTGVGTLSPSTCFDQIEQFDEAISDQFESTRLIICVSPAMARAYRKARRDSGIYTIQLGQEPDTKIDFTEHTLIGLPSMTCRRTSARSAACSTGWRPWASA